MIAAMAAAVSPSFPKTLPKLVKRFDKVWLPGFRSTFASAPPSFHRAFIRSSLIGRMSSMLPQSWIAAPARHRPSRERASML
jgi:hypothetical protein